MNWQENFVAYSLSLTAVSIVLLIGGALLMRQVVIYLPADYFTRTDREDGWWFDQHKAVRWTLIVLKNLLGIVFLLTGFTMLFVPGPGVLFLLLGLALVNVPGKRRMELWLLSFPAVHQKINALRARHGRVPLELPRDKAEGS